jgi:hypothetical protein
MVIGIRRRSGRRRRIADGLAGSGARLAAHFVGQEPPLFHAIITSPISQA